MVVVLLPVYTAVIWHWVYMSQYVRGKGMTLMFQNIVNSVLC
jgi:hypothetical protein